MLKISTNANVANMHSGMRKGGLKTSFLPCVLRNRTKGTSRQPGSPWQNKRSSCCPDTCGPDLQTKARSKRPERRCANHSGCERQEHYNRVKPNMIKFLSDPATIHAASSQIDGQDHQAHDGGLDLPVSANRSCGCKLHLIQAPVSMPFQNWAAKSKRYIVAARFTFGQVRVSLSSATLGRKSQRRTLSVRASVKWASAYA